MSSFLSLLFTSLLALFFYAHCSTKITPCDGDPTADPEFECLPLPPPLSESEYDGGDYKIPFSGIDGLDKYELQELCFGEYVNEDDLQWDSAPTQDISARRKPYRCHFRRRAPVLLQTPFLQPVWLRTLVQRHKGPQVAWCPPGDFRVENSGSSPLELTGRLCSRRILLLALVWDAVSLPPDPSASNGVVVESLRVWEEG